jgi:hypothetical protein
MLNITDVPELPIDESGVADPDEGTHLELAPSAVIRKPKSTTPA